MILSSRMSRDFRMVKYCPTGMSSHVGKGSSKIGRRMNLMLLMGINSFHLARLQPSDPIMHRKKQKIGEWKRGHNMLTWKTQQSWEKPRQPTDCRKSLWEEYNNGETQRKRPLAPLLCHTAVTVEATTSFSLSLSISLYTVTLYTHTTTKKCSTTLRALCPKSYLYTYDFQAIYTYGPKGLTRAHSRMCPFQLVEKITTGS